MYMKFFTSYRFCHNRLQYIIDQIEYLKQPAIVTAFSGIKNVMDGMTGDITDEFQATMFVSLGNLWKQAHDVYVTRFPKSVRESKAPCTIMFHNPLRF